MGRSNFAKAVLLVAAIFILAACTNDNGVQPESDLILIRETDHGLFYSQILNENVEEMIESLATEFESNYHRIVDLFEFHPSAKSTFHVYTNHDELIRIIGRNTEGT
ncbi:hypothetical protein XYCOK13_25190 [Xylanibacillus composti]|uniref:Uncharacterized protein n=1 Tax=Xylanibacillus composti TaxID=1572762 RepID=A0A8J4M336_9BACL|nr:hypothetical protein [Xylanibacillus composti]GIQ69695.1 hypothetical protein XYCOK13_25190 [Xylanibacillus composti]